MVSQWKRIAVNSCMISGVVVCDFAFGFVFISSRLLISRYIHIHLWRIRDKNSDRDVYGAIQVALTLYCILYHIWFVNFKPFKLQIIWLKYTQFLKPFLSICTNICWKNLWNVNELRSFNYQFHYFLKTGKASIKFTSKI